MAKASLALIAFIALIALSAVVGGASSCAPWLAECDTDSDCGLREQCNDGVCEKEACSDDADCDAGEECRGDECRDLAEDNVSEGDRCDVADGANVGCDGDGSLVCFEGVVERSDCTIVDPCDCAFGGTSDRPRVCEEGRGCVIPRGGSCFYDTNGWNVPPQCAGEDVCLLNGADDGRGACVAPGETCVVFDFTTPVAVDCEDALAGDCSTGTCVIPSGAVCLTDMTSCDDGSVCDAASVCD